MNIDFVGVQRMDEVVYHDEIVLPLYHKKRNSRGFEKGHSSYRCTRGFKKVISKDSLKQENSEV